MKTGRRIGGYCGTGAIFDPMEIPLSELIQTERAKIEDLDLSVEPQVRVSWSESDDLLPMATGDFKSNFCFMLAKNAERCGFHELRTVQRAIIPFMNYGNNVCIATGGCSGKTVGYLVPLIQKIYDDLKSCPRRQGYPRALIVTVTREKAKHIFNLVRMLTDGLGINICLSIMGMDMSHYRDRDRSDITVMTHRTLHTLLEDGKRINLGLLKTLVLEGVDGMRPSGGRGVVWVQQILKHCDEEAKRMQLITIVEDVSFLDSEFCKQRIFNAENTVEIENGDQVLSPSNHSLVRVNKRTMSRALLALMKNYDNGKVVIVFNPSDRQQVENEVMETLKTAGIPYFCYRKRLEISERTEIQRRFARGERQVLVTPYCNIIKCLRFPGIKQIIHVEPPFDAEERYETSYNHSASCVAFNRQARSVVLCHVDNNNHARQVQRLAEIIGNCQTVEGWPRSRVPEWATEFHQGKRSWSIDDAKAGEELWDLEEASLLPSESSYGANAQPVDRVDQSKGYHRDTEQSWDYGSNPPNALDSSCISSPSPAPIGDVYHSYNQPENYYQYPNPPQQQTYAYRQESSDPQWQNSMGNEGWNDRRDVNPSRQNEALQGCSRFQEPDGVFKYDDFEEQNIGYREFRSSGCNSSRDVGRDRRPPSSSYQGRYYQDEYSDSRDGSRQEYNFGRKDSYRAQGSTSRESIVDRQNPSSYKNEYPARQMTQNNVWEGSRMRQGQGSHGQEDTYQNWQADNRAPNRQVPVQQPQQEWSNSNVSTRKRVDEKKETPIMGVGSDSEDGVY